MPPTTPLTVRIVDLYEYKAVLRANKRLQEQRDAARARIAELTALLRECENWIVNDDVRPGCLSCPAEIEVMGARIRAALGEEPKP